MGNCARLRAVRAKRGRLVLSLHNRGFPKKDRRALLALSPELGGSPSPWSVLNPRVGSDGEFLKENTRHTLISLIDKANKLKRYGLDRHISATGSGFRMKQVEDESWLFEFDLPEEKELDASLLTLRLFIQQNEAFSFPQLHYLAEDDQLSSSLRSGLATIRSTYFDYLNGHPASIKPGFFEPGENPTRGEILTVVLYGGLAHTNDHAKRNRFALWSRDEIRANVLLQVFAQIIRSILLLIYQTANLCEQELSQNESAKDAS